VEPVPATLPEQEDLSAARATALEHRPEIKLAAEKANNYTIARGSSDGCCRADSHPSVEDHPVLREGLRLVIRSEPHMLQKTAGWQLQVLMFRDSHRQFLFESAPVS
jgi:hypothetical protein